MHKLIAMALLGATAAWGCGWDSNTLKDEILVRQLELHPLLLGQIPHHGAPFYRAQVERSTARLAEEPGDWVARDDLAVAYTKLGRFDEARAHLEAMLEDAPQRYETLSNLGVLAKKSGDLAKATTYLSQALAIKPAGHMGLGDWYLRSIAFRLTAEQGTELPESNFLGRPYAVLPQEIGPRPRDPDYDTENVKGLDRIEYHRLLALIRNDVAFPDTYLVLGDLLVRHHLHDLACLAYVRALSLEHPRPGVVRSRVAHLAGLRRADVWGDLQGLCSTSYVPAVSTLLADAEARLERATSWNASFASAELELLSQGLPAGLEAVEQALLRKGVQREARLREPLLVQHGGLGVLLRGIGGVFLLALLLALRALALRTLRKAPLQEAREEPVSAKAPLG